MAWRSFEVKGKPQTKGSFVPFIHRVVKAEPCKAGHCDCCSVWLRAVRSWIPKLRSQRTQYLIEWEEAIKTAFKDNWQPRIDKPTAVGVHVQFYVQRPQDHYSAKGGLKAGREHVMPTKKPDVDKLGRAVLDGLKGLAFEDDSQVIWFLCEKQYGTPGAVIKIESIEPEGTLF